MFVVLQKFLKRDIVKVFSLTAISTLVKMLTGFFSIKILSFIIGPPGIALLGQLNNLSSIFLTIATGGINNGVTKFVAEYSDSDKKLTLFLGSAFWISTLMSLFAGLTLILGSDFFSKLILKEVKYSSIIVIFGVTLIFYSFNSLLLSILNGFKEYKRFVIVNITSSLIGLAFSITLSLSFGIYGALVSAVTFECIVFFTTMLVVRNRFWVRKRMFLSKFSKQAGRKLAHYSLMALTSASTVPVGQLIIRNHIIKHGSLTDAGLWEGMNRISGMYLLVIISSLGVYYLPRLAELKTDRELRNEIFSTYKLVLPSLLFMLLIMFMIRGFIIQILFTPEFADMERLFLFQLAGDFFKISGWILAYQMIAKSMTKTFIVTEICGVFTYTSLALFLINLLGTQGAPLAHAITSLLYLVVMIVVFRRILFK